MSELKLAKRVKAVLGVVASSVGATVVVMNAGWRVSSLSDGSRDARIDFRCAPKAGGASYRWSDRVANVDVSVRQMELAEAQLIIDYFHTATPEHLEFIGVDPTRLPDPGRWMDAYAAEYSRPIQERDSILVAWETNGELVGFSTADKIQFGHEAYMHLHILDAQHRRSGTGLRCLRETVRLYLDLLELDRLFCEPNAFNVAPNRTLQRAGFRYVMTHMTVPGRLNYHQPVTRWVIEASPPGIDQLDQTRR